MTLGLDHCFEVYDLAPELFTKQQNGAKCLGQRLEKFVHRIWRGRALSEESETENKDWA